MRTADNFVNSMCPLSRKTGSLHLLEPLGPVQACTRMAFIFITICDNLEDLFIALNDTPENGTVGRNM